MESRVFDTLRDMTAILLDADEVIKEAGNSANFRIDQKKTKERISAKEKEITKYNQMLVSLYEDYRDGIVDKSDFAIIKESFEVKVYEGGDIEIVLDCDDEYRKIVARAGELERQHDAERLVV